MPPLSLDGDLRHANYCTWYEEYLFDRSNNITCIEQYAVPVRRDNVVR